MDDLLLIAGELAQNDNFKKDTYEDTRPDGDYEVILEDVSLKYSEAKGTEWFSLKTKILEGDYADETLFINLFMKEKTVRRTLSKIMSLLSSLGYIIDLAMFNNKETILDGLQSLVGTTFIINKTTSNKGYVDYKFKGGN